VAISRRYPPPGPLPLAATRPEVRSPTDGTRKDLPTTKRSTMSEPSSSVPDEIADAEVEDSSSAASSAEDATSTVELDIDQDKVDAWDEVKGDYQVDPEAESEATSTDGVNGGDDSGAAEADSSQSPDSSQS
jgi:hypothetical protein